MESFEKNSRNLIRIFDEHGGMTFPPLAKVKKTKILECLG